MPTQSNSKLITNRQLNFTLSPDQGMIGLYAVDLSLDRLTNLALLAELEASGNKGLL